MEKCACKSKNCICDFDVNDKDSICISCLNDDHRYSSLYAMAEAKGIRL